MGKAIIRIDPEILFNMLNLSNDFKYVAGNYSFEEEVINIFIEHDKLPDKKPGDIPKILDIVYKTEYNEDDKTSRIKIENFLLDGKIINL